MLIDFEWWAIFVILFYLFVFKIKLFCSVFSILRIPSRKYFPPQLQALYFYLSNLPFFSSIFFTFMQFTKSVRHNRSENFCKLFSIKIFQFIQSLVNNTFHFSMYWNCLQFKWQNAYKNQTLCQGAVVLIEVSSG